MARFGSRVITAEYALGVVLPFLLGLISIRSAGWEKILGIWLITIAANYVPLLIYALLIVKAGSAKKEGEPEFTRAEKYGIQQIIILIPFAVVIIALLQERAKVRRL